MSDGGLTAHDLRQRAGSAPEAALRVFGGGIVGGGARGARGGAGGGGGGGAGGGSKSDSITGNSDVRATALAAHGSGSLLAAGLGDGSVELVEVGPALSEAEPGERASVASVKEIFDFFSHFRSFFFFLFALFSSSDDDSLLLRKTQTKNT